MENINNVVSEEIKEDVKVDTVEVKTFTQDEVNEMISKRLQREKESCIVRIRSDHGKEFENSKFDEFCSCSEPSLCL